MAVSVLRAALQLLNEGFRVDLVCISGDSLEAKQKGRFQAGQSSKVKL